MIDRLTRCFRCGRQTSSTEPACTECGACLLVDLLVDAPVEDSRTLHLVAREIDALGGDVPVFSDIKTGLTLLPGVLLSECSRDLAGRVAGILRSHGVVSREVPVRRPKGRIGRAAGPRVGGGFVAMLKNRIRRLPDRVKLAVAGGIAAVVVIGLLAGQRGGDAEDISEGVSESPSLMSSQEIAFSAISASAELKSSGASGAGFFIEPDLLVTCASLVSSSPSDIEVTLANGTKIPGTLEGRDVWLDLAVVRVPGAAAPVLELGESTEIELGETVLAVGNPLGLGFSVSQGIVGHTSRVVMGLSYFQVDAVVHLQNRGGAILDRGGKLIGIAVTPAVVSSGMGLVVPVNYLWSGEDCLVPQERSPGEVTRWEAQLEKASAAEEDELVEVLSGASGPALISAGLPARREVEVVVARVASTHPYPERLEFRIFHGDAEVCEAAGEVGWWRSVSEHDDELATSRFLNWFERQALLGKVFLGTCLLDLEGCPPSVAQAGTTVEIVKGDPRADRVRVGVPAWR